MRPSSKLNRVVLVTVLSIGVLLLVNSFQASGYYEALQTSPNDETSTVMAEVHGTANQTDPSAAAKSAVRALPTFVPPTEVQCARGEVDLEKLKHRPVVTRALQSRAAIAGFHNKSGMLSPVQWRPEFKRRRNEEASVWLSSSLKDRSGCGKSQPPLQFPGCQVLVNHHYKFIWIKGKRVGGTVMRGPLGWVCNDGWLVPDGANKTYCSESLSANTEVSLEEARQYWDDYFVFAFVRNPYARFGSIFNYLGSLMGDCPKLLNFGKLCNSPFLVAKMCSILACCWPGAVTHHIHHIMEQNTCLFTENGQLAVDFIGETESLSADLRIVLDEINRRKDSHLPDLKVEEEVLPKINSQGDSYMMELFMSNTTCLDRVEWNYWLDFERLGYDRITASV